MLKGISFIFPSVAINIASGMIFGFPFSILGSMLGALINIVIDGIFGKYIFNPLCWQLWVAVAMRIAIVSIVFFAKKYIVSKDN